MKSMLILGILILLWRIWRWMNGKPDIWAADTFDQSYIAMLRERIERRAR